jgi:hypothetical protein
MHPQDYFSNSLMHFASLVSGCFDIAKVARASPDLKLTDGSMKMSMTSFALTTWLTNSIGTGLIAYKLWTSRRRFEQLSGYSGGMTRASHSAFIIVIESAAIYLITMTAFLITYLCGSNGLWMIVMLVRNCFLPFDSAIL